MALDGVGGVEQIFFVFGVAGEDHDLELIADDVGQFADVVDDALAAFALAVADDEEQDAVDDADGGCSDGGNAPRVSRAEVDGVVAGEECGNDEDNDDAEGGEDELEVVRQKCFHGGLPWEGAAREQGPIVHL